jgi:phospholipid transport system substrate-binding protein
MLRLIVFILAVSSSLFSFSATADAAADAAGVVTAFHQSLLATMRNSNALGCSGRERRLTPAIDTAFDLQSLSERALRRQWASLDDTQRKDFIAIFRDLVIATYASNFTSFNGEQFETLDTVPQPGGMLLVHARLKPAKSDAVSFDYVLHPVDGSWKIVNVIADGVSDLALRSTQYEQIIKQHGYDGLLSELKTQTQNARACK